MRTFCDKCEWSYDPNKCSKICPHKVLPKDVSKPMEGKK